VAVTHFAVYCWNILAALARHGANGGLNNGWVCARMLLQKDQFDNIYPTESATLSGNQSEPGHRILQVPYC